MSFKFQHLEKIVGVFLTVVILVIVIVVVIIGREQRWFEKNYEYSTKFRRGEGISIGMPVSIKGIQVGEVKEVFLNDENWIEVNFTIFQEYAERIRKDTVVKLRAPLIGAKVLEIIPGPGVETPALVSGSYIWSADSDEGQRILARRLADEKPDQITRVMNNVELLTYNLSSDDGSLNSTLNEVQDFFVMLSDEEGSLNQMLLSLESIMKSIEDKEGSIGKLMSDDYELYLSIMMLMQNLNAMIMNFQELSSTLAETSPEIKAAIERSNRTMKEAIGLIDTLQHNFFIRGFSSKKKQEATPIESSEREGGYGPAPVSTREVSE